MASPASTESRDSGNHAEASAAADFDTLRDARYANPFAPPDELEPDNETHRRSLFGEILYWMLAPLLLLWPMSIAVTYLVAKSIANGPFDRALEADAYVLARQIQPVNGVAELRLPDATRDFLRADNVDSAFFQVLGTRGELVSGDRDMPLPHDNDDRPQLGIVEFRDDVLRGNDIRVAYNDDRSARTRSRTRSGKRTTRARASRGDARQAQPARQPHHQGRDPAAIRDPAARDHPRVVRALARARAAARAAVEHPRAPSRRSLAAPGGQRAARDRATGRIVQRSADAPRTAHGVPETFHRRCRASDEDAARGLAHAGGTRDASGRVDGSAALARTDRDELGARGASRHAIALLALARAENRATGQIFTRIVLTDLARLAVRDWVQAALAKRMDLGYEEPPFPVEVEGNLVMLREMLSNLIDNAIRYTPAGGRITVRVRTDDDLDLVHLEVEDTGLGIPAAERARGRVERFYRILGREGDGSGLGLAIVKEIAAMHGGALAIDDHVYQESPRLAGTLVRVSLQRVFTARDKP